MKKLKILMLLSALCLPATLLYSQADAAKESKTEETGEDAKKKESSFKWPSFMTTEGADVSTGFRRQRLFELSFSQVDLGISNSWFGISELMDVAGGITGTSDKEFSIDTYLKRGDLSFELGIFVNPVSVRTRIGSLITLDLGTSFDSNIYFHTSDDTISSLKKMTELGNSLSEFSSLGSLKGDFIVAASAFGAITAGVEKKFLNDKLWVRAAPSAYVPVLYMPKDDSKLEGGYTDGRKWYELKGSANMEAWYADLSNMAAGLDLALEGRYALWPVFDAGASVENIPVVPAFMHKRKGYELTVDFKLPNPDPVVWGPTPPDPGSITMDYSFKDKDGHDAKKAVLRPTRFNFYGIVKPFKSKFVIIRPDVGFSVNTVAAAATFNWGLGGQVNLPLILSVAAGTKLFEEVWSNYLSLIFDLGLFEVDVGAALRGTTFVSSWVGRGAEFSVGFKSGL
ncbi:MAG: hypothetical protein LBD07_01865 [Spirochaetaceae bacterium]|jgi:hypothetical protein|nr:hypothetical protein [Spirochaetaceae bacterium]